MKNDSTPKKLQELLKELDDLLQTGVVTKDEYECLNFILHHVYNESISNNCIQELSIAANFNYN